MGCSSAVQSFKRDFDHLGLKENEQQGGGNWIIFCLSQVFIGWMWTIVVVRIFLAQIAP